MNVLRRRFLSGFTGLVAQALFAGLQTAEAPLIKSPSLIKHWNSPNFLETPLPELGKSWITPNNLFFVLNHTSMKISAAELSQWQITAHGLIGHPRQFKIRELLDPSQFQQAELPAYLQCCGNG